MTRELRVIHYLNQFFAGRGGEERAQDPVGYDERPIGPGLVLQKELGPDAQVIGTIVGGDSYVATEPAAARETFIGILETHRPDLVIAGPAFGSGRYGVACIRICRAAGACRLPAFTGMHRDNPAAGMRRPGIYVVETAEDVRGMAAAIRQLAVLARRLANGESLGPAAQEGYLPTGERRPIVHVRPGHERAMAMLLARMADRAFRSELEFIENVGGAEAAPPVPDLRHARIALITLGGLVPSGNPDHMPSGASSRYFKYAFPTRLSRGEWQCIHGGFNARWVNDNPNYVLPLDAARKFAGEGSVGAVGDAFYAMTGVWTRPPAARQIAEALAEDFRREGVRAAILTAT